MGYSGHSSLYFLLMSAWLLTGITAWVDEAPLYTVEDSYSTNRFIVVLEDHITAKQFLEDFNTHTSDMSVVSACNILHTYDHALNGFVADMSEECLSHMRKNSSVRFLEEDSVVKVMPFDDDFIDEEITEPLRSWGLDRVDQRYLPLDGVYEPNGDGKGVNVYVIDSGIRVSHEDFGGRAHVAFDAFGEDGNDCHGHGTHCAGTIGGTTSGVANKVTLYGIRTIGCKGHSASSYVIKGVDWVIANFKLPAVASMSVGGPGSVALDMAIRKMIAKGVFTVAAAGNEMTNSCIRTPPRIEEVLAVGAASITDTAASYSNYGRCVNIYAPGVSIRSAGIGSDHEFVTKSGTSMAAPHAAGAAAIKLSKNNKLTPEEVKSAIMRDSTSGVVVHATYQTPNRFLYIPDSGQY